VNISKELEQLKKDIEQDEENFKMSRDNRLLYEDVFSKIIGILPLFMIGLQNSNTKLSPISMVLFIQQLREMLAVLPPLDDNEKEAISLIFKNKEDK
jgi:hypothetical protein